MLKKIFLLVLFTTLTIPAIAQTTVTTRSGAVAVDVPMGTVTQTSSEQQVHPTTKKVKRIIRRVVKKKDPNAIETNQTQKKEISPDFIFANFTQSHFNGMRQNLEKQGLESAVALLIIENVRNRMNMPAWKYKVLLCLKETEKKDIMDPQKGCFSGFAQEVAIHLQSILSHLI